MHIHATMMTAGTLALIATAATAQEARRAAPSSVSAPSETLTLIVNDAPSSVHIVSGTGKPVSGSEFSFGASNQSSRSLSAGKVSISSFNVMRSARGPGTMSLSFDGASSGACPVSVDAFNPIRGVGVVIKKNPGGSAERLNFTGVSVSRCDASEMTFSYTDIMNTKHDTAKNSIGTIR